MSTIDPAHRDPSDSNSPVPGHGQVRRHKMHRREFINSCRFLTFSCHQRLPLLGNSRIRDAFAEELRRVRERRRFRLIAWVIMPDHVHLLIVPRPVVSVTEHSTLIASQSTVTDIMWDLKRPIAKRVIARWIQLKARILSEITTANGARRFWQPGGGFDRNIGDDYIFVQKIRYIHHNPVKRGLVERAEDWPWSSARWYLGERDGQIPIDFVWGEREWKPPQEWIDEAIPIDTNRLRRGEQIDDE